MINVHLQGFRIIIFILTKVLEFFLFGCSLIISSEYLVLSSKKMVLSAERIVPLVCIIQTCSSFTNCLAICV